MKTFENTPFPKYIHAKFRSREGERRAERHGGRSRETGRGVRERERKVSIEPEAERLGARK